MTVCILGRSGRFSPVARQGWARLRAAPPRGFENVTGSPPRQAAPTLIYSWAQPRALVCSSSLFVRMLPAGVRPGLRVGNRSLRSPPTRRRTVSRIRRCPDCTAHNQATAGPPGHAFCSSSLSAASTAQNPDTEPSGAPGNRGIQR